MPVFGGSLTRSAITLLSSLDFYAVLNAAADASAANSDFAIIQIASTPVPEPISMLPFGVGLVGVGGYVRRKLRG